MPLLFNYSVLLLYPDYMTEDFGHETYLAHVEGRDPRHAISVAQKEALRAQPPRSRKGARYSDFYPLLVCREHIEDERPFFP